MLWFTVALLCISRSGTEAPQTPHTHLDPCIIAAGFAPLFLWILAAGPVHSTVKIDEDNAGAEQHRSGKNTGDQICLVNDDDSDEQAVLSRVVS